MTPRLEDLLLHFERAVHVLPLLCLLLLSISVFKPTSPAIFHNPKLPSDDLFKPGDLLIGGLVRLYYPDDFPVCGRRLGRIGIQVTNATIWSIERLNRDPNVLPNITLGYAILNDCGREGVALGRSTKFLPASHCLAAGCGPVVDSGRHDLSPGGNLPSYYPVAAVLGPYSSSLSVPVSSLLSLYEVPHASWSATGQQLSDKSRFRYFSRLVPPDQYQAMAIVDVLSHFGWTYISTLHSAGTYGSSGIREVHRLVKQFGICVAYSGVFGLNETTDEQDEIIRQLRKHAKAKAVVVFSNGDVSEAIFKAIRRNGANEFIYLGADGFQPMYEFDAKPIRGFNSFTINFISKMDEEFKKYYTLESNPWRNDESKHPWFGEYSPSDVNCSWNIPEGQNGSCHNYKSLSDFPRFSLFVGIARVIDIVYTYAFALDALIRDQCPEASRQKWRLADCVTGPLLLTYIRKVSFHGSSGYVAFDDRGDLIGDYVITQTREVRGKYVATDVGTWSRRFKSVDIDSTVIKWSTTEEEEATVAPASPWPESVCAKPCDPGEFYIQGELKCCWECKRCRDNERLREDVRGCVKCLELFWPDPTNFSVCEEIPPTYLHWYDPIGMALMVVTTIGILSLTVLTYIFIQHSDKKVIKGSSRELMAPIKIGIFFAYFTVYTYIIQPGKFSCNFNYFGFFLSCTFIFGPLFLKTNRLYRIFSAAERCEQGVRMVDSKSQLLLLTGVVLVQVLLTVMATLLQPSAEVLRMPVETKKNVEVFCSLPLQKLLIPLGYNLILLLLCAVFGFLTRRLPDNFNESWYIFISVMTTMFVWVGFLPTYFAAFYASHKTALLALALILNGIVTSLCLFLPKVYALYCVDENSIKVTNWNDNEETNSVLDRTLSISQTRASILDNSPTLVRR